MATQNVDLGGLHTRRLEDYNRDSQKSPIGAFLRITHAARSDSYNP